LPEGCTESCRAMRELQGDDRGKLQSEYGAKELSGSMLQVQSFTQIVTILHLEMLELQDRVHNACGLAPGALCAHQQAYEKRRKGRVWGGGQSARWHLAWTIH
jgi:hypothetical protein